MDDPAGAGRWTQTLEVGGGHRCGDAGPVKGRPLSYRSRQCSLSIQGRTAFSQAGPAGGWEEPLGLQRLQEGAEGAGDEVGPVLSRPLLALYSEEGQHQSEDAFLWACGAQLVCRGKRSSGRVGLNWFAEETDPRADAASPLPPQQAWRAPRAHVPPAPGHSLGPASGEASGKSARKPPFQLLAAAACSLIKECPGYFGHL
ncbi:hypothetical protein H920_13422 [Fukomys damarensis]|uniref:Uncharacterized protein n=1 Tax=Fukomys damarensis TaxID=885580 RepID=A0A091DR21_FUKDA|nr:hypothetical protein H920_13422 [Fukomys damarensis]